MHHGKTLEIDLATFCREEYPRLLGMLSLYCGDRQLAEVFAQEALAIACRDWPKVQGMDHPQAWLYRVAVNLARSTFGRRRAEQRAHAKLVAEQEHTNLIDVASDIEVRKAVSQLPRRQREALIYRHFLDFSIRETAIEMGCSEGTVRALTNQAKNGLRKRLIDCTAPEVVTYE